MLDLFNPSSIKELCRKYHLTPSKHYGQHFLIFPKPIQAMVEVAELKSTDAVIEIGPGFGVLTLAIAPKVKRVVAFEIEKRLSSYWDEEVLTNYDVESRSDHVALREQVRTYGLQNNIEIVWGNVLNKMQNAECRMQKSYKVVANLPYQITSDVLRMFLEAEVKPEKMVVMVQKEVAERICATPRASTLRFAQGKPSGLRGGSGSMSLLSVAVQYYGVPRIVMTVPRTMFWPVPRVDSAVVLIDLQVRRQARSSGYRLQVMKEINGDKEIKEIADKEFFRVVKAGFSHKRKQLWRNLSAQLKLPADKVKEVLREVGGSDKVRAEELSVGEWRELTLALTNI